MPRYLSLFSIFVAFLTSSLAFCGDHRSPWTDEELERCYRAPNCHVIDDVPVIDPDHPLTIEARQSSDIVTNIVASEGIVNTATCRPYDIVHGTLVRTKTLPSPQTSYSNYPSTILARTRAVHTRPPYTTALSLISALQRGP
jgi:hypothetical protein